MSAELIQILTDDILNTLDGAGSDLSRSEIEEDGVWIAVEGSLDISALCNSILNSDWLAAHNAERDALRAWKANAQITLDYDKVQLDALASVIEATKAATKRGNLMTPTWVLDALNGTTK